MGLLRGVLVGLVGLSACIRSELTPCGELLCPAGNACIAGIVCVTAEQAAACDGKSDGDACDTGAIAAGICISGACVVPGCGNRLIESGEMCDDGNQQLGDGCSADCLSNEQCGNGVLDFHEECEDGGHLSGDGCSSMCLSESMRWETIDGPGLPDVGLTNLVYDEANHRLVMFGDSPNYTQLEPPWIFDGTAWTPGPLGPAKRQQTAAVYDPVRQRVVVFGGYNSVDRFLGDTWELDATGWTKVMPTTSPPPRAAHAMVWDPVRTKIVMFGGYFTDSGEVLLDDTWTYDGTTWTKLTLGASPSSRRSAALAFDENRQQIVLYGGDDEDAQTANETWVLESTQWTMLAASTPATEHIGNLVFDRVRDVLVLFAGSECWEGDGVTWTMRTDTPTGQSRAAVFDPEHQSIVWWNGRHHELTTAWFTHPRVETPTVSSVTRTAFDDSRRRFIMRTNVGGGLAETWARTTDGVWTKIAPSNVLQPPPSFPIAYDPANRRIVAFGSTSSMPRTWVLDGDTWQMLSPAASPQFRSNHALAYDLDRQAIVLFGGSSGGNELNDTWQFDGATWMEIPTTVRPEPRLDATLAYDPVRKKLVMVGGTTGLGGTYFQETWELDGSTWTEALPPPAARSGSVLIYHPVRKTVMQLGGVESGGGGLATIVELDGTAWRYLVLENAIGTSPAVVFDPYSHELITHGVAGTYDDNAIGKLRAVANEMQESCSGSDDLDGDSLLGCADPDCYAYCDPLCPPGASCATTRARCGDGVCDPSLETPERCAEDCP